MVYIIIIGLIGMLITFLLQNPWLLIVAIGLPLLILIIKSAVKAAEVRAEINEYYSVSRWTSLIGWTNRMDTSLTEKIRMGERVCFSNSSTTFANFYNAHVKLFLSQEKTSKDANKISNGQCNLSSYGISYTYNPVVLRSQNDKGRGLCLCIFDGTVLAFVNGPERNVFIGAYDTSALTIESKAVTERKSIRVDGIYNEVASTYKDFCPIKDSKIIAIHWQVENLNGKRSRRGGMLPEHNPLQISLEYALVGWRLGNYSLSVVFSNESEAKKMCSFYNSK